jgi:hypothetical protein
MVWVRPPGRAGFAPQASRHSSRVDAAVGAGGEGEAVAGDAVADAVSIGPEPVEFAVEEGCGTTVVAGAALTVFLGEQALPLATKPTLPANNNSWRRV